MMIHCENTSCKHYYEDNCINELIENKMVCIDKGGKCESFVNGVFSEYLRVYQMNDYEWWVTNKPLREFYPWYLNEHGIDEEDNPLDSIVKCDIDKQGLWCTYYNKEDIERIMNKLDGADEVTTSNKLGSVKVEHGEYHEFISFRQAIEEYGTYTEPYCIASRE